MIQRVVRLSHIEAAGDDAMTLDRTGLEIGPFEILGWINPTFHCTG